MLNWIGGADSVHVLCDQPYMKQQKCEKLPLKTVDTIGNYHRPVFSLSVSTYAQNNKPVKV